MRTRRTWILLPVCALLAILLIVVFRRGPEEPSYEGRRLSEWIDEYRYQPWINFAPGRDAAGDALRHIGTNALPCLLAWLDYEPAETTEAYKRGERAIDAFGMLGPLAAPAIPELTRQINLGTPRQRELAMIALSYIGPEAQPAMIHVLTNLVSLDIDCMIVCLRNMGTNARPLFPLLVQKLQSENMLIAAGCAGALGESKVDPDLAVPALTKSLADPRQMVRLQAARTLAQFGGLARPALPALSNVLTDPDPEARVAATNAIRAIFPEALTNAPAQ